MMHHAGCMMARGNEGKEGVELEIASREPVLSTSINLLPALRCNSGQALRLNSGQAMTRTI
ncbi:MAG TPA: hypothetical protein VGA95_04715 [Thermodesulfobacteriota bacterium]